MTDTRQAPAGWYTDPDTPTQLRWWDGEAWGPTAPPTPAKPKGKGFAVTSLTLGLISVLTSLFLGWDAPALLTVIIGGAFGIIGAAASRNVKTVRTLYITALVINALAFLLIFW